jgi:hypothetical protein
MPTDLSQKNNVRDTAEVSKARVGIVAKFMFGSLFLSCLLNSTTVSIEAI